MPITAQQYNKVVKALRMHAILSWTQPGLTGDKIVQWQCEECDRRWLPDQPEVHEPGCLCILLPEEEPEHTA